LYYCRIPIPDIIGPDRQFFFFFFFFFPGRAKGSPSSGRKKSEASESIGKKTSARALITSRSCDRKAKPEDLTTPNDSMRKHPIFYGDAWVSYGAPMGPFSTSASFQTQIFTTSNIYIYSGRRTDAVMQRITWSGVRYCIPAPCGPVNPASQWAASAHSPWLRHEMWEMDQGWARGFVVTPREMTPAKLLPPPAGRTKVVPESDNRAAGDAALAPSRPESPK